jgi:hypothetical protein
MRTDEVASTTNLLRVKVGNEWRCAIVDRSHMAEVEQQLLREAIPSDPAECPDCAAQQPTTEPVGDVAPEACAATSVQAAAISLAGRRMMVILVPLSLVQTPGEAEMLVADLRPRFGGVDLVLMGQDEDGTPHYHGEAELLSLLAGVPVDRLPWKAYGPAIGVVHNG